MKKVIFTLGGKGGVGKTKVSTILFELLHSSGIKVHVVDLDISNPDFHRNIKTEYGLDGVRIDVTQKAGIHKLIDTIEDADKDSVVIINSPYGMGYILKENKEFLLTAFEKLNVQFEALWPISRTKESINMLTNFWNSFGSDVHKLTVLVNNHFGSEEDFYRWNPCKLKKALVKADNVVINQFPDFAFPDSLIEEIIEDELQLDPKDRKLGMTEPLLVKALNHPSGIFKMSATMEFESAIEKARIALNLQEA